MKRLTNDQLNKAIKELLERGEIVIGMIRVNDGETVSNYSDMSICPPKHREGYRRALESGQDAFLSDVVYKPVFLAREHASSVATLE